MLLIAFEDSDSTLHRFSFSSDSSILSMGGLWAMSLTTSASSALCPLAFSYQI